MMRAWHVLLCAAALAAVVSATNAHAAPARRTAAAHTAFAPPPASQLPKAAPHPRLLMTEADVSRLRAYLASPSADAQAKAYYATLQSAGAYVLEYPTNSSNVHATGYFAALWSRIVSVGLLYRVTGNTTWAQACIHETLSADLLFNWGGPTYLETSALTIATAIGYDWCYDQMTADNRTAAEVMIVDKGINLQQYRHYAEDFSGFTNRNLVGNIGYLMGALALWDVPNASTTVTTLWNNATSAMQHGLLMYDGGGWWEGYVYWGYATEHTLTAILSLNATFGSDFGLSQVSGLKDSGEFVVRMFSNATGHNYAWADSGPTNNEYTCIFMYHNRVFPNPAMAYSARLAIEWEEPNDAPWNHAGGHSRFPAWSLMFWDNAGGPSDLDTMPLAKAYTNVSVAFVRSNWSQSSDPQNAATLLSFKGGGTYWSHNHRDLGSFAYESHAVRWAQDLGLENYGAGGADNPDNYRITTLGHNTLAFSGANQVTGTSWCVDPTRRFEGACKQGWSTLTFFNSSQPQSTFGVVELGTANEAASVAAWRRGVATIGPPSSMKGFVVVDEFAVAAPQVNVSWGMHTHATLSVAEDGAAGAASLAQNGSSVGLKVLEFPGTSPPAFTSVALTFPPPLLPDPGVSRVQLVLDGNGMPLNQTQRLVVAVLEDGGVAPSRVAPLDQWQVTGPFT